MTATPGSMVTLQQAFALLQPRMPAARLVGDGATPLLRVHTDTRTLQAGDLFVALKGERFDANAFLADARAGGAAAAIAHGGLDAAGLPGIDYSYKKIHNTPGTFCKQLSAYEYQGLFPLQ